MMRATVALIVITPILLAMGALAVISSVTRLLSDGLKWMSDGVYDWAVPEVRG